MALEQSIGVIGGIIWVGVCFLAGYLWLRRKSEKDKNKIKFIRKVEWIIAIVLLALFALPFLFILFSFL
jgi:4-hydroxybenzoate polyprenyltransferase